MAASIDILAQKGFPSGILNALRRDGITHLLDPQVQAVNGFDLLGEDDLLISLPTSCGKTLLGELAGVGTALQGKRAVFSVPLKAIAREKFESFQRRYADYGLRVRLATGEFTEHQQDLRQGAFDIAVVIHEKLKHLILQDPAFLSGVGVVILDELQGTAEPGRGANLEFLLALLKNHRPRVRRVGLAGKLSPHDPLVEDFDSRVLAAHTRPIDLHEGIVLATESLAETALSEYGLGLPIGEGKVCIHRSHNTRMVDAVRLPTAGDPEDEEETFLNLAAGLVASGETVLIFLSTRREAEQAAGILARRIETDEAALDDDSLEGLRNDRLLGALKRGVGFHHADCSPYLRSRVEEWFREGRIRVLCCTSTLAQGVNLPAHNVLIHPFAWNRHGLSGEMTLLEESVVRNMAGRAGRLGNDSGTGRALLVAHTEREWDLYRSRYWTDRIEPTRPGLLLGNFETHLLSGVAGGHRSREEITALMKSTLSHRFVDGTGALERRVEEILEEAEILDLIHPEKPAGGGGEACRLSELGKALALRGVSFETGRFFSDWLDRIEGRPPEPLTLLYSVCSCIEALEWSWPRERNPLVRAAWTEQIRDRIGEEVLEIFEGREPPDASLSRRLEDAAKMAVALEAWSNGEPMEAVEAEAPRVSEGGLQAAGEGARWLLETLGDVWRIKGFPTQGAEAIQRLARSAGSGLPDWAAAWEAVPRDLLDRETALLLARTIPSPKTLLATGKNSAEIRALPEAARTRLLTFLEGIYGSERKQPHTPPPSVLPTLAPARRKSNPALSLDLVESGAHFRVHVGGEPLNLGLRSAELLLRLVRARMSDGAAGWTPKDQLGIDPESLTQRISDLRIRLGKPPTGRRTWIESDRKGRYRIALEAGEIAWNPNATPPELEALLAT